MSTSTFERASTVALQPAHSRLDYLDATRAFALVLGVVFHASLSFMPIFIGWAVQDVSTSPLAGMFFTVSHSFRMETFFLLAGFFSHLTFHRKGTREFVQTRVLRIVVPFLVGWFILRPLIVSGWIMGAASLRGDYDFWSGINAGFQSLSSLPAGMFNGTHLWFLYYLAMITALVLVFRALVVVTGSLHATVVRWADSIMGWLAHSAFAFPILVIPPATALWFMQFWGMDTPDQALKPHLPVLVVYGGFFVFGWLLSRRRDLLPHFARLTPLRWFLAAAAIAAVLRLSGIQADLSHPHYTAAHVGFVVTYAFAMWSLVFLTIGVFRKLCQRSYAWVRYIADSSYWMYLIHLPIVVWLQVAVAELALHWSLKLVLISMITVAVSLITYDLFVRSTWVGWLLNGRRRSRVLSWSPASREAG
jgi:glucans biosynthesis protein C